MHRHTPLRTKALCAFVVIAVLTIAAEAADLFRDLVIIGDDESYKLCVGCFPGLGPIDHGVPLEAVDIQAAKPALLFNDDSSPELQSDWRVGADKLGTSLGFSISEGRYRSGTNEQGELLEAFRPIFEIVPDARTNSMVIGANGVGFGTAAPGQDLHLQGIGGDAGIRFDQGAQQWDLRGKSDQFWLRDVTASKDLLVVTKNALVGLGTSNPQTALHINRSILPSIRLETTGQRWDLKASSVGFWLNNLTAGPNHNPLIVQSDARHLALVLQGSGVGLGTAPTPGIELEIAAAVPEIRFSQTSGISWQWDLFASDGGFGIQDETSGGNRVPFRIEPGAPSESIRIKSGGNVGMGTSTPAAPLHIVRAAGTSIGDNVGFRLENSSAGSSWVFTGVEGNTDHFIINKLGSGTQEMRLNEGGNMSIPGTLTTGGPTCSGGCDSVFQPEYELESIEDHASSMWKQSHLPGVGRTQPGQPMNLSEKVGGLINELEKAHIYIERLHERLKARDERIRDLERRFNHTEAEFANRLSRLEGVMRAALNDE